jgi:hypothetical protein
MAFCMPIVLTAQDWSKFQKPFSEYTVNPDSCIRIEHTSGSLIFIESKAIQTSKKVVKVVYREFLTPLDMIAHGINMTTTIAGKRFALESSGMFEIYALDGPDTLRFDPEKRMEVRLAGKKALPGTEGFKYDPQRNDWDNFTNLIESREVTEDDNLWGSSIVQEEMMVENMDDPFSSMIKADTVMEQVFQAMEIDEFGMYNYDRIIEGLDYIYLKPSFVTGTKALNTTIYVVYDDINSVFYFPESTWENDFFLIQGKAYKMFTFSSSGQVYLLNTYPDVQTLRGSVWTFNLVEKKEKPSDRASLSALIGVQ